MKKTLSFLTFLVGILFITAQADYQKVRIFYKNSSELRKAINLAELDHYKTKKGVYLECDVQKNLVQKVKDAGISVEILEPNLLEYYQRMEREYLPSKNISNTCSSYSVTDPVNYKAGSMGGYLTYSEVLSELDLMKSLYPNLITTKAGISNYVTYENRPLYFVKISDNPTTDEDEKRILYTAMHHAREPGSMQQLIYYMWYLLENYSTNPEIKQLVDNTEIFCVPLVNPDGYVYNQTTNPSGSGMWRKNRKNGYGVDNNRNYSYQWGTTGTSNSTSSETYCGPSPFSEPENQAIKWLCEQKNFGVAINAHTYSQLVLYPYGYQTGVYSPDDNTFKTVSAEMVKHNGYTNQISWELYPASGDSDDWMYGDTSTKPKIYAFTPEISLDFWEPSSQIKGTCTEMVHTNLTALRILHNYAIAKDTNNKFLPSLNNTINYSLTRLGLIDNQPFKVKISPISSNIISVGTENIHTNLALNTTVNGSIALNLKSEVLSGEPVVFKLEVDNGTYTQSETITKYYGTTVNKFTEEGNSTALWTVSGSWNKITSTFVSAPSCLTDTPSGNYSNYADTSIKTTTPINLSNAVMAELEFYAKWDLEKGYDYVTLEISKDNGTTWTQMCGKHTTLGTSDQLLNKPLYDGTQSNWVKENIDISEFINQNILIRFRLKSDSYVTADGFYLDNLSVNVLPLNTMSVIDSNNVNSVIYPNPTKNLIHIKNVKDFQNYKIYSMNGRLIKQGKIAETITVSDLKAGVYYIELDGNKKQKEKIIIEN